MIRNDIVSVKETVEDVLEHFPVTRNSDRELIIRVLVSLGKVVRTESGILIPFDKVESLPSFESITRCRRKIQAPPPNGEGRFLPCAEIGEMRKEQEQSMREINKWCPSDAPVNRPHDGRLF